MSKIGKINISIPEKVKAVLSGNVLNIEGPLGKKSLNIDLEMFKVDIVEGKTISIKPNKGDVVVFHNCLDGTSDINPKALHAGSPVISGEKWAVNLWFRQEAIY